MRVAHFIPLLVAAAPVVTAGWPPPNTTKFEWPELLRTHMNHTACRACHVIMSLLRVPSWFGERTFLDLGKDLCKASAFHDPDVCDGVMEREGPAMMRVVKELLPGTESMNTFCNAVLGLCVMPEVHMLRFHIKEKRRHIVRPPPSGRTPLKVVHFSDIHVDTNYTVGSSTHCKKPICCRAYTDGDAPGVTKNPAGPFGDHKCDSPVSLEQSMYEAMKEIVPDPAFAIFTGDIVDHTIWNNSRESNTNDIHRAMTIMDENLKIVYGTVGNHDMAPVNLVPSDKYSKRGKKDISAKWLYEMFTCYWPKWTGASSHIKADMLSMGAYAARYPGCDGNGSRLRIISLNTNLYYRLNFEVYHRKMERDPDGQFAWLAAHLASAERAGDRVYIIGHMPMGEFDALHNPSANFDFLVNRYADTIAGMFWGHTHLDHFEIHYSNYMTRNASSAAAVSYIAPSLTPTSGMPSFRVYDVDPETFAVLDFVQYTADMDDPAFQATGPVWKKYYSAKEAYGALLSPPVTDPAAEMTAAFWHNVTDVFETDAAQFDAYIARKSRGWEVPPCTGDCARNEICQLRAGRASDHCHFSMHGHMRARHERRRNGAHDDCGGSATADALALLATDERVLARLWEYVEKMRLDAGAKSFDPEKGWVY